MSDFVWGVLGTIFFGACVYVNCINKHTKSSKKTIRIVSWALFITSVLMMVTSPIGL